jgi:hypothetical protein
MNMVPVFIRSMGILINSTLFWHNTQSERAARRLPGWLRPAPHGGRGRPVRRVSFCPRMSAREQNSVRVRRWVLGAGEMVREHRRTPGGTKKN